MSTVEDMKAALAGKPPQRGTQHGKLKVFAMSDLDTASGRKYIVKGLIGTNEISLWVGPPKCGKSFLLMDIAYRVSLGLPVFGRRVKQTNVLYVACEGEGGIGKRLTALREKYGHSDAFHYIAQPADLLRKEGQLEDLKSAAAGAGLIVIDTVNRVMAGGDENSPQDMGQFVANMTELRDATKAHVALIHHGTKASNGTNPRGHSSLTGADDALIEIVKNEDGSRTATIVHAKDDVDGNRLGFAVEQVEVGTDEDGDAITTLVVKELDTAVSNSRQSYSTNETIALRCLLRAMTADGEFTEVGDGQPKRQAVLVEDWRRLFYEEGMPGAGADAKQKAFKRATASLVKKEAVHSFNDWVWQAQ